MAVVVSVPSRLTARRRCRGSAGRPRRRPQDECHAPRSGRFGQPVRQTVDSAPVAPVLAEEGGGAAVALPMPERLDHVLGRAIDPDRPGSPVVEVRIAGELAPERLTRQA